MSVFFERVRDKVLRNSFLVHTEGTFWRSYPGTRIWETRNWLDDVIEGAELLTRQRKTKGKQHGGLGHVAIELLKVFCNIVDYRTGRLDPSYLYLQEKTGRSIDAIARGLRQLRALGFIDWKRRFKRTTDEHGRPRSVQITNAYRIDFPKAAKLLVDAKRPQAPAPECEEHRQEELKKAKKRAMRELGCGNGTRALYGRDNSPIGDALAKLGDCVDLKEDKPDSAIRREPVP